MPVRKRNQCIFVWAIMDWEVNNVHSGKKKWYLMPKTAKVWHSKGWKFLSALFSNTLGSQNNLKCECCIHTTRERVTALRFKLLHLTFTPHLERGCKKSWELPRGWRVRRVPPWSWQSGVSEPGTHPVTPAREQDSHRAARAEQHPWSRDWWLWADWNGAPGPWAGLCVWDGAPAFRDTNLIP